jgi:hypothetical protein
MKNIEMMRATRSTEPRTTMANVIAAVTSVALRGSFVSPSPRATNRLNRRTGMMWSAPIACSVRGATSTDPTADESVAQASPIGMMGPQSAMSAMAKPPLASCSGVALKVSFVTRPT